MYFALCTLDPHVPCNHSPLTHVTPIDSRNSSPETLIAEEETEDAWQLRVKLAADSLYMVMLAGDNALAQAVLRDVLELLRATAPTPAARMCAHVCVYAYVCLCARTCAHVWARDPSLALCCWYVFVCLCLRMCAYVQYPY